MIVYRHSMMSALVSIIGDGFDTVKSVKGQEILEKLLSKARDAITNVFIKTS